VATTLGALCVAAAPAVSRAGDEIFGPLQSFHRSGSPTTARFSFPAAEPSRGYVLKLSAGGWRKNAVSPSLTVTVRVNGTRVLLLRKLTKRRPAAEIAVTLRDTNALTIRIEGSTGTLTTSVVPIVVIDTPAPGQQLSAEGVDVAGHLNRTASSVTVNGLSAVVSGLAFSAAAVPLAEGRNVLAATSICANAVVGAHRIEVVRDATAPAITLESPADGTTVTTDAVDVAGTVDDPAASVSVNGAPVPLDGTRFALNGLALALGENTIRVEAADELGNRSAVTARVTRDLPLPTATLAASADRIAVGSAVTLAWETSTATRVVIEPGIGEVAAAGSVSVAPRETTSYTLTAVGAKGVARARAMVIVLGAPAPLPEESFGAGYQSLVPEDATLESYDARRFAVVTGLVTGRDGQPLEGVAVTVHGRADYGTAMSDAEGRFSLPVDGGSVLTLVYRKPGCIIAHRQVQPRWEELAVVETVALIPQDPGGTAIALDGDPQSVFVHRGSSVADESGTRAATVVIRGDTRVYARTDAGDIELADFTLRATEFATPEQMPAALPPTSAFTYCVDLSIDGVEHVRFSRPVTVWVDNFLGFDAGVAVPAGYYDVEQARWVAAPDGRVVALLDGNGDGIVDALDADGDGIADDLNGDGSFADEVAGLADAARYLPGATFWRVDITHLSWWDFNWGWSFALDDIAPNPFDKLFLDEARPIEQCQDTNSFVECQGRIYHDDLPIAGTDLTLHYSSARVPGYKTVINVPVSGATVPRRLLYIVARLLVGGR
jgi:hypothetical protein